MTQTKTKIFTLSAIALLAAGGLFGTTIATPAATLAEQAQQPVQVTAPAAITIASGQFEGRSDHVTRGQVQITQTPTGYEVTLSDDFYLDGAPDPVLGFGQNGEYITTSKFSALEKKRGGQTYTLPTGFTPANFSEIYVWCEKFSVPLGVATLTKA